jgi:hypothetical protein
VGNDTYPPRHRLRRGYGRSWSGSHVHLIPIDEGGTQLYPGGSPRVRHRLFPAGCPPPVHRPTTSGRYTYHPVHAHHNTDPDPPGFESVPHNEASVTGFSRIPSRLAHRARPIWQYWNDSTLSGPLATRPAIPTERATLSFITLL